MAGALSFGSLYAAPGSIARLKTICKAEVRPIEDFKTASSDVRIFVAPGTADMALFIKVTRGLRGVVYVGELLIDLEKLPGSGLLRILFYVMGSRPGFRVNRGYVRF